MDRSFIPRKVRIKVIGSIPFSSSSVKEKFAFNFVMNEVQLKDFSHG